MMVELLLGVAIVLLAGIVVLLFVMLTRKPLGEGPNLDGAFESLERASERTDRALREELRNHRTETTKEAREARLELNASVKAIGETLHNRLQSLTQANDQKLETIRETVEKKLEAIQTDNNKQLGEMRKTVDEKLHETLEKRLGESFKVVSERLEKVHHGLGEMHALANGVGDLKKVLTNVKTRGTWGEIQLAALLAQVLTPEQYSSNVATTGSGERVEFAIHLPGSNDDDDSPVWLPIDSKFPVETYQRLCDALDRADAPAADTANRELERQIKLCAATIAEKYLAPPKTTDFAIMFLPTEGLYAELVQRVDLVQVLLREYRVVVAGPSTLAALLNSLQMGFRTLAIQKRSSEVWQLLAAVKAEFGKFGDVLGAVQKKLQEASNTIDKASVRTRAIERKLRSVETLPATGTTPLLAISDDTADEDAETIAYSAGPQ